MPNKKPEGRDNPEIDRGESAGPVGDLLGMGRGAQPVAANENLYSWGGPSQYQLGEQRKEAMGQQAPRFESGEAGVGGEHMGRAWGVKAQQAEQTELGQYYKDVLEGRRESAGAQQLKAGGEQALAAQLAASRQVKGAGMGTARYNAAQMGAQAQAQANQQAGIMRAQEQAQAAGAYGGLLNQQQMANIASFQAMQQSDQFRAAEQMKQNALNAQMGLGYSGLGIQAGQAELQGGIAQGQNFMTAQGLDASQRQADQAQSNQMTGAAMSAAAMLMMSDIRAKSEIQPAGGNYGPQPGDYSGGGPQGWQPARGLTPTGGNRAYAQAGQPNFRQALQQGRPQLTPGTVAMSAPGSFLQDPQALTALGPPGPNANPTLPSSLMTQRARTSRAVPNQATPSILQAEPAGVGTAPMAQPGGLAANLAGSQQMMSDPLTKVDITPAGGQSSAALEAQVSQGGMQAGVIPQNQQGDTTSIGKSMLQGYQAGKGASEKASARKAEEQSNAVGGQNWAAKVEAMPTPDYVSNPAIRPQAAGGGATNAGVAQWLNSYMAGQPGGAGISTMAPVGSTGYPSAGGQALPAQMPTVQSDRRIKDVEVPGGHTLADDFLAALTRSASTYSYKNPADEPTDTPTGGKYLGVMAQEVEKTPTGETLVKDGPKGKYLEMGPSLSAALAGLGRLNERLDTIEDALGAKRSKSSKKEKK
jgi:hypothetical protein